MTNATRTTLWAILSEAFQTILNTLQASIPEARMTAGHGHNDVFPFRAYAEYSKGDRAVDVSFDVQAKDSRIHAFGDIALADGLVIKSLMEVVIGAESCDEGLFIARATDFALQCQKHVDLIARELSQAGAKNRSQDL
jgi:hypothetical protein